MEQRILGQDRASLYYDLMQELKQYDVKNVIFYRKKEDVEA